MPATTQRRSHKQRPIKNTRKKVSASGVCLAKGAMVTHSAMKVPEVRVQEEPTDTRICPQSRREQIVPRLKEPTYFSSRPSRKIFRIVAFP